MFKEDPNIIEAKTMDIDETTGYPTTIFTVSQIPMMSKRESLIKIAVSKVDSGEHAGKHFCLVQSIMRDDFPVRKDAIRIDMFKGSLLWND